MKFDNLEMYRHYDDLISSSSGRTYPIRLYTSDFRDGSDKVRWHIGFPKEIIDPVRSLLETTLFWGDPSWHEDGDFYVYWTSVCVDRDSFPHQRLQRDVDFRLRKYRECLARAEKWSK